MTEIGSILGGRYRLLELLGQGGMATIYRARDAQLERDVAVKVLRAEFGQDPDFVARFGDEARAAASLSHPNIVAVFDFGRDPSGDQFIVMELVEGQDIASILRENGPLAPRQAARVAADVAKALHAAHSRGIVHRDVKPSNILISRDGRVKVVDFGIARALDDAQITLPGITMGSVHYFAPEQARGEPATAASDVYALGIVLFEMLTGQRPFSGDGAAAVALARLSATPPPPSSLRASVPAALDAIVARAMALDPADRFASAAAMSGALDGFLTDGTAGAAGAAGATVAGLARGGVAPRPAAPRVNYPPDAYAGTTGPATVTTRTTLPPPPGTGSGGPYDEPEDSSSGPWAWIAGVLGIGILVVVAFLLFRMISGGGSAATATQSPSASASSGGSGASVTVPNLVNSLYSDAATQAAGMGLSTQRAATQATTTVPADTVLAQDPQPGASVPTGTVIKLTVAVSPSSVSVPDLTSLTIGDAANALAAVGLKLGTSTEAFDPTVPAGQIVTQDPAPGSSAAPGSTVSYTVSMGPQPSPSPTPTLSPTQTPPPVPTATPVPAAVNVGNYQCRTLSEAASAIAADGFAVGAVTTDPAGVTPVPASWIVSAQEPAPGTKAAQGTSVNLTLRDPATFACTP